MNIAPKPPAEASPSGQDFWDVGQADFVGQQTSPDQEFSELVEVDSSRGGRSKVALYAILALVVVVVGWFAFEVLVAERDPMATLAGYVGMLTGEDGEVPSPEPQEAPPPEPTKSVAKPATKPKVSPAAKPPAAAIVDGNPYWTLPNRILGAYVPMRRQWAPEEEETLRGGLSHRFPYQRYKTVMDVRARRLGGSEAVLWDAMQDKKFWTRMFAAVGLAEFNVAVSMQSLESALSGARSELVADFFERFVRRPKPAELFLMRQVVRLLDAKGRRVVLSGIARSNDKLRDLYLVAATQDPAPRVRAWAERTVVAKGIGSARFDEMLTIVRGAGDGEYLLNGGKTPAPKAKTSETPVTPVTPVGIAPASGQEPQAVTEVAGEGDVEFYEEEPAADPEASEGLTDPDTFEYEDDEDFAERY